MKFKSLQENLRKAIWERIDEGELTGLKLAEQTGFKQAHISNFLNRKRSLSMEGMDRVLNVQHLSVLDLLDPAEVNKRASIPPPSDDEFENIFVVESAVAATQPLVMSMNVREIQKFKRSLLIDRHYNSLQPYRKGELNMYAIYVQGVCKIRYVELAGKSIVLRPHNQTYAVEVLAVDGRESVSECLVGRVCYVGMET